MKRGDIYLVSLDPIKRHEQQGARSVLVVSPDHFNTLTRCTAGRGFAGWHREANR